MANQIIALSVPVSDGDGPATNVSTLVGEKTIELSGTYVGQYTVLGSHDGVLYVPLLTFDSGAGAQAFKQTTNVVVQFMKVRRSSTNSNVVGISVAGATTTTAQFIALTPIPAGQPVGPLPSVDVWGIVVPTGFNGGFSAICGGNFVGTISLEGSLDGVQFTPLGGFILSPGRNSAKELSPLVITDTVRFVRLSVAPGTGLAGPVSVTLGGDTGSGGSVAASFASCFGFSFGHGVPNTDDVLPANVEQSNAFWITKDCDSDHAEEDQVHEWEIGGVGAFIAIDAYVYLATLLDDGTPTICKFVVTINGSETGVFVSMISGFIGRLQANAAVATVDGDRIGLKWKPDAHYVSGNLRMTAVSCATLLAPTPIPPAPALPSAGLLAQWESDPSISVTTKDGANRISGVTDATGNGFDLLQPTANRQPLWVPGQFNGFPAFDFDDDMSRILAWGTSMFVQGQPRTVIAVAKPRNIIGGELIVFRQSSNYFANAYWRTGGTQFVYENGTTNLAALVPVSYSGVRVIFMWKYDGAVMEFSVNGVVVALGAQPPTFLENGIGTGGSFGNNNAFLGDRGLQGQMAAGYVWDHVLSAPDTTQALAYQGKYL